MANKTMQVSFFNCCHTPTLKKFQQIPPTLYTIVLLPPFAILPPSETKKVITPSLKNFISSPSFWVGEDTLLVLYLYVHLVLANIMKPTFLVQLKALIFVIYVPS